MHAHTCLFTAQKHTYMFLRLHITCTNDTCTCSHRQVCPEIILVQVPTAFGKADLQIYKASEVGGRYQAMSELCCRPGVLQSSSLTGEYDHVCCWSYVLGMRDILVCFALWPWDHNIHYIGNAGCRLFAVDGFQDLVEDHPYLEWFSNLDHTFSNKKGGSGICGRLL